MSISRRTLLGGVAAFASGALTTAAGDKAVEAVTADSPLPLAGGYAPATHSDRRTPPKHSHTTVRWSVDVSQKLIALTFDDGPAPRWTPQVLDMLDELKAPATFFLVGERVRANARLIHGRLGRHEAGNHTWSHLDMAKRDLGDVQRDLLRTHEQIRAVTGREPRLLRPPYGHLGGSAVLAAAELGYTVVLWSLQMLESSYVHHPAGLADYIVGAARPGTILLAHDTGPDDRLVAIRNLPRMITGLRREGFELVTVSDLLAAGGEKLVEPSATSPAVHALGHPR